MNRRMHDDSGLGLIEIVVSMFMIALIAIAFLPFLIHSFQATRANTTLATANQLLDQQFDQLRQLQPANCSAVESFRNRADAALDRVEDTSRRVTLTVTRSFTCPTNATRSGAERMTITIVNSSTGAAVTSASTIVYVTP